MDHFSVHAVAGGLVRLDLTDPDPHDPLIHRFCRVIDLQTARMLTILLINAIEQAEVDEVKVAAKKGRKK